VKKFMLVNVKSATAPEAATTAAAAGLAVEAEEADAEEEESDTPEFELATKCTTPAVTAFLPS
jgi:hypothetical protein